MDYFAQTQLAQESFTPAKKSPMGRARVWLWLLIGLVASIVVFIRDRSSNGAWLILGLMLVIGLLLDWVFRQQLTKDRSPVVLSLDGIESIKFMGKQKSFRWSDIASAHVEPSAHGNVLQLVLRPGAPGATGSWFARWRKPTLPLTRYAPAEQEQLLDAVLCHLREANPQAQVSNSLTEEREFQEKLKALAPNTWVTYALVAANVAVWALMLAKGVDGFGPSAELLFRWGGNAASEVQKGQWWRMVTSTFLHGGLVHLLMNMVGLWSIGQLVERIYGHRPYLLIYMGSAIAGSALSMHFAAQRSVSVGASGAVFGIAGALLVAVYQHRSTLPKVFGRQNLSGMGFFVLYSLVQGFTHSGIDNGAHVGGLLAGCMMAFILPERFDLAHHALLIRQRSVLALLAAAGLTAGVALSAPPAEVDIPKLFSGSAAFARGVKGFEDASRLMQNLQAQHKAGTLTELELDTKSRTDMAPAYRKALLDLNQAWVPAEDPRGPLLQEIKTLCAALIEALAMESVVQPGTNNVEPADPARMAILNLQMQESSKRIHAINDRLEEQKKRARK